jgi:hypothetical protein
MEFPESSNFESFDKDWREEGTERRPVFISWSQAKEDKLDKELGMVPSKGFAARFKFVKAVN